MIKYRPDIDGLRAIAVLGVIFSHFELGLPGGYVGVDVFFVISGYLISLILFNESYSGKLSLWNFWARRVRRILPASILVMSCTICLTMWLTDPITLSNTLKETTAQSVFTSNIYFNHALDYFAESADYRILLHTWSLSVEEQFYMVFPPLLLILLKWPYLKECSLMKYKLCMATIIIPVAALSLCMSWLHLRAYPQEVFYLPHYRAWEFLAGTLLALVNFKRPKPLLGSVLSNLAFLIGMVCIMYPMFLYHGNTAFPGHAAIPPVVGTALVILGSNGSHAGSRLLGCRPMAGIGLISYSLYLWHWPLYSLLNHNVIDPGRALYIALLVLCFALSWLSYKYVETPFRTGFDKSNKLLHVSVGLAANATLACICIGIFSLTVFKSDQLEERMKSLESEIGFPAQGFAYQDKGVPFGAAQSPLKLALWGDSHALVILETLDSELKKRGVQAEAFCNVARRPIPGYRRSYWTESTFQESYNQQICIQNEILAKEIPHLLLVARWTSLFHTDPWSNGRDGTPWLEGEMLSQRKEYVTNLMSDQIRPFEKAGTTVWIMHQPPESDILDPLRRFMMKARNPRINNFPPVSERMNRTKHELINAAFDEVLFNLTKEFSNIKILDPSDNFFADSGYLKIYSDMPFFRDGDHVSKKGVIELISPSWEPLLNELKSD